MKVLFFACIFFISMSLRAQPSMLGKTATTIKEFNLTENGIGNYLKTDQFPTGKNYLVFISKEDPYVIFYYVLNKSNICEGYMIMDRMSDMIHMVENLNKSYIKVDASHWISKDNTFKIFLDPQGEDLYVTFSPI